MLSGKHSHLMGSSNVLSNLKNKKMLKAMAETPYARQLQQSGFRIDSLQSLNNLGTQ